VKPDAFDFPPAKEKTPEGEMKAAMMLIDAMAKQFDAAEFHDKYREELKKMLEARAEGAPPPKAKKGAPTSNVVDLMAVLQKSLSATKAGPGLHAPHAPLASKSDHGRSTRGAKAPAAKGKKSAASKATSAPKRKAS
jgi:DNA end-binding protein Ku